MRHAALCLLVLTACKTPQEAREVRVLEPPKGLQQSLEIDPVRFAHAGHHGPSALAVMLDLHLGAWGLVRQHPPDPQPPKGQAYVLKRSAQLPAPGYALDARIEVREDELCRVVLSIVSATDGTPQERAPFSAIHAMDQTHAGLGLFRAPRLAAMTDARFAKLAAQAADAAKKGLDQPLTRYEYARLPRPLDVDHPEIYYYPQPPGALEREHVEK
jgi:hypothetical protein